MIHPDHIDPETGRPYAGYSSDSLDTSFHDHEMDLDDEDYDYDDEDLTEDEADPETEDRAALHAAVDKLLASHQITGTQAEGMRKTINALSAHELSVLAVFAPRTF